MLKRAVWLGNDETHYVRKWEDKDISDLKRLIKLTVNWIENNLLTQDYMSTMEEKRRKRNEALPLSEVMKVQCLQRGCSQ